MVKNPSKEFQEKKELVEMNKEAEKEKHKLKMEELAFIRETERLKHEWDMEKQRIKSAEIRRNKELKELQNMNKGG